MPAFDLNQTLRRVSHWLPTQGPIKDFIHHNTLHAFQDRPFHEGLRAASRLHGAHTYMDLEFYREACRHGAIRPAAIDRALDVLQIPAQKRFDAKLGLISDIVPEMLPPPGLARDGLRGRWKRERELDLDGLVHPVLFKLIGAFLDQGVAVWRMPHTDRRFLEAVRDLIAESWLPLPPLSSKMGRELLRLPPEESIAKCLKSLVGAEDHYESYLLEMLLAHPGWSGIVGELERNPGGLILRRKITLKEFVALELILEVGWATRRLGKDFRPLVAVGEKPRPLPTETNPAPTRHETAQILWQEAMEWSLYEEVLAALELNAHAKRPPTPEPSVQAFFCIDDREGSVRRYLEELDSSIHTYATAGFFGIAFLYQGIDDCYPAAHCPVVVSPKHLLRSVDPRPGKMKKARLQKLLHLQGGSNTIFRGWLITQVLGLGSAIRLALSVFRPAKSHAGAYSLSKVETHSRFHLLRESDTLTPDGYLLGFSIPEMVDRVHAVLKSVGLTQQFARLVVLFAHGSSSANNPHFAAYDCGACSGKPGAPNARAFAQMANSLEVREELKQRGIEIPPSTHFVGALHDTARDEIMYFDLDALPESHAAEFEKFRATLTTALQFNAKERCRRFELVDPEITPEAALAEVRRRSVAIFEPRPEMNHATNALCIVGRRDLARGLFLDRRAFANSYDPTTDPQGDLLAGILNAVVPVCGGINLEYYFSRTDNRVFGAGTKIPHNVMGLIGVGNGVEGDLQTGLPMQMVEIHDPVRLLLIVEQEPDIALSAVNRNPPVFEWIKNDWIRYACFSPSKKKSFVFLDGKFQEIDLKALPPPPMMKDSLSIFQGITGNIGIHFIDKALV